MDCVPVRYCGAVRLMDGPWARKLIAEGRAERLTWEEYRDIQASQGAR